MISPTSPSALSSTAGSQPGSQLKRSPSKWLMGLGLLGLVLIAIPVLKISTAASSETETVEATASMPVETLVAEEVESYQVTRAYTGEIASPQASELGFERSGQLIEILVPEGSQVAAGTPLARLDIRSLQTQRSQLEAEKARAIAQFSELETGPRAEDIAAAAAAVEDLEQQIGLQRVQLARREILYEKGAISQEALDEFSFGEGSLQARLNQARAALSELQNGTRPEQLDAQNALVQQLDARIAEIDVTIDKSTIISPFSGTVAEHAVDTGTVIGAGQSVIRLVESNIPEARIGLPVDTISKITLGEERTIEASGNQFTGRLISVLPEVNSQTRTQTAVFALEPRAANQVSPGQTVRLTLTSQIQSKGIWLPTEALTQGIRGLWTCYVVVPQNEASGSGEQEANSEFVENPSNESVTGRYMVQPQSVEVVYQEGDRAFVTGTLQPGSTVVASGAHRLVPQQTVNPVKVPE